MKINRKRAYRITCVSYVVIALILIALGLMNLGGVAENSDVWMLGYAVWTLIMYGWTTYEEGHPE